MTQWLPWSALRRWQQRRRAGEHVSCICIREMSGGADGVQVSNSWGLMLQVASYANVAAPAGWVLGSFQGAQQTSQISKQ